ncbi:MAG: hypothetical protein AB1778_07420 [Candidatus Bipolaricaulota bacterium]
MNDEDRRSHRSDADEVREVLSVVSTQVPGLLRGLRDVLYSAESAESMAAAVATFYKKLVDAGIPREDAMDMTRGYMINLRDLFSGGKGIRIGSSSCGSHDEED